MSTEVFPTLPGLGFSVKKTPMFQTRVQTSLSGKEARIADWTTPRYTYELTYDILREHGSHQELKEIAAFWLNRRGSFDTFLFLDPDDFSVTGQGINTGDGVATVFKLLRSFGAAGHPAWIDPILAPSVVTVYIDGVVVSPLDYSLSFWGSDNPGILTFTTPPPFLSFITADLTYYWPCRFVDDTVDFEKFMDKMWQAKKVSFITVK